ncbi:MAG: transglycosylase SLT domain-containing protein [Xanthobacteraceae bacterium]
MRRLNTSTILFAALLLAQPVLAEGEPEKAAVAETAAQTASPEAPAEPASKPPAPAETAAQPAAPEGPAAQATAAPSNGTEKRQQQLTRDGICRLIESAANGEALPFEFFARLIWQESRFNPQAVSPAGARGIAQFMPKTAHGRGLADPFEPASALQESAEFLRELVQQFGNVGLAAAAYNAGPKRVNDWLAKRGALPRETQNYVQIITGRSAEKWAAAGPPVSEQAQDFQCNEIAKLVAQRRNDPAIERLARAVAQRLSRSRGDTPAAARGSARNGILAKRTAPPTSPRNEQVAKATAQPHGPVKVQRIIKITAKGHDRARVQVVSVVVPSSRDMRMDRSSRDMRRDKVAKLADQRGSAPEAKRSPEKASRVQTAAISAKAKGKTVDVAERTKTKTADSRERRPSNVSSAARTPRSGKVRAAANGQTAAEKSCSQTKVSGRKSCRQA